MTFSRLNAAGKIARARVCSSGYAITINLRPPTLILIKLMKWRNEIESNESNKDIFNFRSLSTPTEAHRAVLLRIRRTF